VDARRIAADVVGVGLATPIGRSPDEFWSRLVDADAGMAVFEHPELPPNLTIVVAPATCVDSSSPDERSRHLDRSHVLATVAAQDALAMVPALPPAHRRAVVCGVGYGAAGALESAHRLLTRGPRGLSPLASPTMMAGSVAAHLAMRFGFEGPCLTVGTACASGADAIGQALGLLRSGAADVVLAGGVDAMLVFSPVIGMHRTGALSRVPDPRTACRPFDRDRDGMVLGEGAGFVVLRRADDRAEPAGRGFGRVVGYAATCDAHHVVAPRPDGASAVRAVRAALADAGVEASGVSHVNAHGSATRLNDAVEARVVHEVFGASAPPVIAVKGATGHMIGGSGAVEAIASLMALRNGVLPPTAGLVTPDPEVGLDVVAGGPRPVLVGGVAVSHSFGFGGHNAVLVLAADRPGPQQPLVGHGVLP
jgi:3-oxoacyl-[acyl-carrier-protein] synthase II